MRLRRRRATTVHARSIARSPPSRRGPRAPSRAGRACSRARARSRPMRARVATCARTWRRRARATSIFAQWTVLSVRGAAGARAPRLAALGRSVAVARWRSPWSAARLARTARRPVHATSIYAPSLAPCTRGDRGVRARSRVAVARSVVAALSWRHATVAWPVRIPPRRVRAMWRCARQTALCTCGPAGELARGPAGQATSRGSARL